MIGQEIAKHHMLPEGAAAQFYTFHALLCEWNARMDLTNVPESEALHKHYLDSLSALPLLPEGVRVLDIGAGAGFPGMPIAIARPDVSITLLDALRKRVDFLTCALSRLPEVHAEAVHARAEDFAKERREAYDVVISRAVASLPVLLEFAMPFLRVGGHCIFWKGARIDEELQEAQRVTPLLGGGMPELHDATAHGRQLVHVVVPKVAATDARFPRKAGMATKRPL